MGRDACRRGREGLRCRLPPLLVASASLRVVRGGQGKRILTPYETKYLAAASSDVLDTRIRSWISDNPDGPWQYLGVVATEVVQQGQIGYDARVADLTGAGWTAVYSVNGDPHHNEDVRLYRGQFAPPNAGTACAVAGAVRSTSPSLVTATGIERRAPVADPPVERIPLLSRRSTWHGTLGSRGSHLLHRGRAHGARRTRRCAGNRPSPGRSQLPRNWVRRLRARRRSLAIQIASNEHRLPRVRSLRRPSDSQRVASAPTIDHQFESRPLVP